MRGCTMCVRASERPCICQNSARRASVHFSGSSSVQGEAGPLASAGVAFEKRGMLAGDRREHVAALGFLLDQDPAGIRPRRYEGVQPDVAVPFMQEIAYREPRFG